MQIFGTTLKIFSENSAKTVLQIFNKCKFVSEIKEFTDSRIISCFSLIGIWSAKSSSNLGKTVNKKNNKITHKTKTKNTNRRGTLILAGGSIHIRNIRNTRNIRNIRTFYESQRCNLRLCDV